MIVQNTTSLYFHLFSVSLFQTVFSILKHCCLYKVHRSIFGSIIFIGLNFAEHSALKLCCLLIEQKQKCLYVVSVTSSVVYFK